MEEKKTSTVAQPMVNDGRLTQADADAIKTQGETDLNEMNSMYDGMIANNETLKNETLGMIEANKTKQEEIANANTAFTIDKIEQEKAQAKKDYTKEQSGAYVDWQKQRNQYGANAEQMAANGLANGGYSESSQVAMYVAYQNRVAVARESYNQAIVDYNNAITEARLQNNSVLAEIAINALKERVEAIITFTQQGNALLTQKADAAYKIKQTTHSNWMDALKQIEEQNQFDQEMAYKNSVLAWEKEQANKTSYKYTGGNTDGDGDTGNYTPTKDEEANNGLTVDEASIFALGYGPISEERLYELVQKGEVIQYIENGVLKFRKPNNAEKLKNSLKVG